MRIAKDFPVRDEVEREFALDSTWCGACGAADLGMTDPYEYEDDGRVYVEGRCRACGGVVRNELVEKRSES